MHRILAAGALGLLLSIPAISAARTPAPPVRMVAPQYSIKTTYAKQLIRTSLITRTGHRSWKISAGRFNRNMPVGPNAYFSAYPRGNPGMLSFDATVNMIKAKQAPRGVKRVQISPQGCLIGPNSPLMGPR